MTRQDALHHLATDPRTAGLTAGTALRRLTQAFKVALEPRDLAFFEFHAEDPCHEVARACAAGHAWHGDESGDAANRPRRPHWHTLEQEVVAQVIRKN